MASQESAPGAVKSKPSIIKGASYEAIGYIASQAIRLVTNMVLTRLVAPEAFGLAAIVLLVNQGLVMFSDLGLLPSLVQNKRGGEEKYLNTAWTLQILQGVFLTLVSILLAWPLAHVYDKQLVWLIGVGGIALLFRGFTSHAQYSLRRNMRIGPLVTLDLTTQVVGGIVTIALAYWLRSVWALVLGLSFGAFLRLVFSYLLEKDFPHRLLLDPEAKKDIFHVGKWVFFSSVVGFLSQQGDRLIMGKMVGIAELGVYSIAVLLSGAVSGAASKVVQGVVFPALAATKEQGTDKLRETYYRVRRGLDFTALPALGGLCALGSLVVEILYDDRFADAGWMLQLLVLRAAMACMLGPCETCLFAIGRTRLLFLQGAARALWLVITIPIAYYGFGLTGLVVATALSEVPVLLLLWPAFQGEKLLRLRYELRSVIFFAVGFALGLGVLMIARMVLP